MGVGSKWEVGLAKLAGGRMALKKCGRCDWWEVGGGFSKLEGGGRLAPQTDGR